MRSYSGNFAEPALLLRVTSRPKSPGSPGHSCEAGSDRLKSVRISKATSTPTLLTRDHLRLNLFNVNGREVVTGGDLSFGVVGEELMESFLSIIAKEPVKSRNSER